MGNTEIQNVNNKDHIVGQLTKVAPPTTQTNMNSPHCSSCCLSLAKHTDIRDESPYQAHWTFVDPTLRMTGFWKRHKNTSYITLVLHPLSDFKRNQRDAEATPDRSHAVAIMVQRAIAIYWLPAGLALIKLMLVANPDHLDFSFIPSLPPCFHFHSNLRDILNACTWVGHNVLQFF